jgi:hypothetical protein
MNPLSKEERKAWFTAIPVKLHLTHYYGIKDAFYLFFHMPLCEHVELRKTNLIFCFTGYRYLLVKFQFLLFIFELFLSIILTLNYGFLGNSDII